MVESMYVKPTGAYSPNDEGDKYMSPMGDAFQRDYQPLERPSLASIAARLYDSLSRDGSYSPQLRINRNYITPSACQGNPIYKAYFHPV